MNRCYRCHGYIIQDRFEDLLAGTTPITGYKCVNCGSWGDLPNASWQGRGIQPYNMLQVEGQP